MAQKQACWILLVTLLLCACRGNGDSNSNELQSRTVTAVISAPVVAKVNEEITLSAASSSSDSEFPLDFQWSIVQEPGLGAAEVTSVSAATTTLIASMEGVYRLRLKVSSGVVSDVDEYEIFAESADGEFPDDEDIFSPDWDDPEMGDAGECKYVNEYGDFDVELDEQNSTIQ